MSLKLNFESDTVKSLLKILPITKPITVFTCISYSLKLAFSYVASLFTYTFPKRKVFKMTGSTREDQTSLPALLCDPMKL